MALNRHRVNASTTRRSPSRWACQLCDTHLVSGWQWPSTESTFGPDMTHHGPKTQRFCCCIFIFFNNKRRWAVNADYCDRTTYLSTILHLFFYPTAWMRLSLRLLYWSTPVETVIKIVPHRPSSHLFIFSSYHTSPDSSTAQIAHHTYNAVITSHPFFFLIGAHITT